MTTSILFRFIGVLLQIIVHNLRFYAELDFEIFKISLLIQDFFNIFIS